MQRFNATKGGMVKGIDGPYLLYLEGMEEIRKRDNLIVEQGMQIEETEKAKEAWRENKLYLENELALKTEEIAKCNRALATQQYDDLQLLGEREEKIQQLERKLDYFLDLVNDDGRAKRLLSKSAWPLGFYSRKEAVDDYRAMLKEEVEK